jgi:glycolate oxidase iron-sulfur subunit
MQTELAPALTARSDCHEAATLLRACVHCGFCTATCPTYQLFGDELDGPRGRLYLVKQVLEGQAPTARTQLHLDRCLSCRACETACPSGVQYARVLDIGRALLTEQLPRGAGGRLLRRVLAAWLTGPLFAPLLGVGRLLRPLLWRSLRRAVPRRVAPGLRPTRRHARRMLLLEGCVQPTLAPNINAATARVLDALGIELLSMAPAGCCGAIRHHLDEQAAALQDMRHNIDAWWPAIQAGAEAIVITASGCGTMVKDYGRLLQGDARYAAKAERVSALARDLAEVLPQLVAPLRAQLQPPRRSRVVFHPPCSLQHGQQIQGVVEALLTSLGAQLLPFADSVLCCGSAGTYTLLQPDISAQLRERKLAALLAPAPDVILSANIGCLGQLAAGGTPVQHWIEWLDERLR